MISTTHVRFRSIGEVPRNLQSVTRILEAQQPPRDIRYSQHGPGQKRAKHLRKQYFCISQHFVPNKTLFPSQLLCVFAIWMTFPIHYSIFREPYFGFIQDGIERTRQ